MNSALAAVLVFLGVVALHIVFILPFVFNGLRGLFETPDVGTVVGLVGAAVITGPVLGVAVLLAAAAAGFFHGDF